ncbi:hypothetical protein IQ259_15875 [Fortiea sp. LEGE XX443]|uniref:hypothetical protein n=1 Tax=Fortiea sp. LEGE XX443 TaxID=1828611 RepID=UPI001A09F8AA|nr:hypothetical protein [Fortiea sp. LEGE XX443]
MKPNNDKVLRRWVSCLNPTYICIKFLVEWYEVYRTHVDKCMVEGDRSRDQDIINVGLRFASPNLRR